MADLTKLSSRHLGRKLAAAAVSFGLLLLLPEFGYRIIDSDAAKAKRREDLRDLIAHGSQSFEPRAYVGFIVKQRKSQAGDPTRPKDWSFDFENHDNLRIACLGGSTTWGGYPRVLKTNIEAITGVSIDVMNWGVSGWSTQETMINYFINVQDYSPDILILHHALNEVPPRTWGGYRNDYAHYRRPWIEPATPTWKSLLIRSSDLFADWTLSCEPDRFTLDALVANRKSHGINGLGPASALDPATISGFARNMRTIVENAQARGTRVLLMTMPYKPSEAEPLPDGSQKLWVAAVQAHNQFVRELASELGCALADAEAWSRHDPEGTDPLFTDRVHMTSEGIQAKVGLLVAAMQTAGWNQLLVPHEQ